MKQRGKNNWSPIPEECDTVCSLTKVKGHHITLNVFPLIINQSLGYFNEDLTLARKLKFSTDGQHNNELDTYYMIIVTLE